MLPRHTDRQVGFLLLRPDPVLYTYVVDLQHPRDGPHAQSFEVHLVGLPLHLFGLCRRFDRNGIAVIAGFTLVTLTAADKTIFHEVAAVALGTVHKNVKALVKK